MKTLVTVTAVIELGAGFLILALPSQVGTFLLGSPLSTAIELSIARVAGVALLALGVACWYTRCDEQSRAARGLAGAMMVYNLGVVAVLVYAAHWVRSIRHRPVAGAVLHHTALAVWRVVRLLYRPAQTFG